MTPALTPLHRRLLSRLALLVVLVSGSGCWILFRGGAKKGGDDDTGDEDHDGLVETEDPEEPRMYVLPPSSPHYEVPDIPPPPSEPVEAPKELAESRRVKWVGEMKSSGANSQLLPRVDANQDPTTATFYLDLAKATYTAPAGSVVIPIASGTPIDETLAAQDRFNLNLFLVMDESRFELTSSGKKRASLVEGQVRWSENSNRVLWLPLDGTPDLWALKKAQWNMEVKADAPVGWTDLLVSAWIRPESSAVWMPAGEFQMPVCIYGTDQAVDCPGPDPDRVLPRPLRVFEHASNAYAAQIHFVQGKAGIFGIMYSTSENEAVLWRTPKQNGDGLMREVSDCVKNQRCDDIGDALFSAKALQRLAEVPDDASIFVRNTIETLPYVPVDLVLRKDSAVFQALINDDGSMASPEDCVQQWVEMVPRSGAGLQDPTIKSVADGWRSIGVSLQCDTPNQMLGWLMGADQCTAEAGVVDPPPRRNIGLTWASHFNGTFFGWPIYNDSNKDDAQMLVSGGHVVENSLAILHVCDGAQSPKSPPVDRFSDLGFESIITTISEIPADVAISFNGCWKTALESAWAQPAPTTVGDLYKKTRRCLQARGLSEQKYYQFFGNPDLTICPTPPPDSE